MRSRTRGRGISGLLQLPPRRLLLRRAIVFTATAALPVYLAFEGGGYELVVRQKVALVVWAAIALGFALGVLPRARPSRAALVPVIALAGLVLWVILSLTWTESQERTGEELARLLGYAGLLMLLLCALNRYTFRAAAAGVSVAILAIAGVALASRLFPESFPGATDVARVFRGDRLDFPLDYWNAVGAWSAMAVAVGLAWSAHARLTLTRCLSLAAVPIAGTAVYLTYSRGGVLGSAVAVIAVLVLSRNRWTVFGHALVAGAGTLAAILTVRQHQEIADATGAAGGGEVATVLIVAALVCGGTVVLTSALGLDRVRIPQETAKTVIPAAAVILMAALLIATQGLISRAWDEFQTAGPPPPGTDPAARLTSAGGTRDDIWDSGIDAFAAHPVGGTGAGTFEFWWSRDGRDPEFVRDAHSLYIEALAELGLPGLLLLAGFLVGSYAVALQARRKSAEPGDAGASIAMLAVFTVFLVNSGVDWMWEETAVAVAGLGAVAIAMTGSFGRLRRHRRRGPLLSPGVRSAVVVLALAAAVTQIPGIVAAERLEASQEAARDGDLTEATVLAEDAIDAQPWAATPHLQLALVLEADDRLMDAQDEIEEAISKEDTNWRFPLVLARIQAARGERRAAKLTFWEGRQLRPTSPSYSVLSPFGQSVFTIAELRKILSRAKSP